MRNAFILAVLLLLAVPALADDMRVEVLFDGHVRAGYPVSVRVRPVPDRVRAEGAPWVEPAGVNGDEFVLPGVAIRGSTVTFEVHRDGASSMHTKEVRPLLMFQGTAAPGSRSFESSDVRLSVEGLPTVPEAWRLWWRIDLRAAPALPAAVRTAAEEGVRRRFLDPWRADRTGGGIDAFRALASAADGAPVLTRDVSLALVLLAAATALLALLLRTRRERPGLVSLWLTAPCIVALAWLLAGDRLPGALRGASLVLDDGRDSVTLVRVEAVRDGSGTILPSAGAGRPTVLHVEAGDGSEEGVELLTGRGVRLTLERGRSRILAFPGERATGPAREGATGGRRAAGADLQAWLRRLGLRASGPLPLQRAAVAARGLRIVPAAAWSVEPAPK